MFQASLQVKDHGVVSVTRVFRNASELNRPHHVIKAVRQRGDGNSLGSHSDLGCNFQQQRTSRRGAQQCAISKPTPEYQ